jgi:ADP-ribose pyrophosphatase
MKQMPDRILVETPFLRCIDRDGWFFVERPHGPDVVVIVAVTSDQRLLLVEQTRAPVRAPVIELPAGLVGDEPDQRGEPLEAAAGRELCEETGYRPGRLTPLSRSATSPGMTNEMASFFLATELEKIGPGGGTAHEHILVHEIPIAELRPFLRGREAEGCRVSVSLFAGLALAGIALGR